MMNSVVSEAIARIQCDVGLDGIQLRNIPFHGWAIVHKVDEYRSDVIYSAGSKEECEEVIRLAQSR